MGGGVIGEVEEESVTLKYLEGADLFCFGLVCFVGLCCGALRWVELVCVALG